jgi:hypothetical protein
MDHVSELKGMGCQTGFFLLTNLQQQKGFSLYLRRGRRNIENQTVTREEFQWPHIVLAMV